ncbi:hypothetical protein RHMOL_Rhmol07G0067100 [Rhododendron molle]|uniref:Uncharacterized protein n=1 Tax=Rhododendron molle TaxID=49168 RepID=A0ACC0MXQ0_RHOML|nr:hypothetical protein RHMOL_Rhmol07G0067100 [Rhododendron molle]
MAQLSSLFKALTVLIFVVAVFSASGTAVLAQQLETAPAPAPSKDTGSGYSLPISGVILCSSFVLSLLAFVKK